MPLPIYNNMKSLDGEKELNLRCGCSGELSALYHSLVPTITPHAVAVIHVADF